jgi:hypothetical protein
MREGATGSARSRAPTHALPREKEGGKEGVVSEADLSGGGAASPTSSGSPPPMEREERSPLRGREGGSHRI